MRSYLLTSCLGAVAFLIAGAANANDELIKLSQNPKDWAMPAGNYANTRYSQLKQINTGNVGKLQVAWTFSTGVLRGHEGAPLVIGDVMYVTPPSPTSSMRLISTMTARSCGNTSPNRIPMSFQ
jgi:lanthanide-dependent methanol dehydrogenase